MQEVLVPLVGHSFGHDFRAVFQIQLPERLVCVQLDGVLHELINGEVPETAPETQHLGHASQTLHGVCPILVEVMQNLLLLQRLVAGGFQLLVHVGPSQIKVAVADFVQGLQVQALGPDGRRYDGHKMLPGVENLSLGAGPEAERVERQAVIGQKVDFFVVAHQPHIGTVGDALEQVVGLIDAKEVQLGLRKLLVNLGPNVIEQHVQLVPVMRVVMLPHPKEMLALRELEIFVRGRAELGQGVEVGDQLRVLDIELVAEQHVLVVRVRQDEV